MNSGVPEGLAISVPLETPVVLRLNDTNMNAINIKKRGKKVDIKFSAHDACLE
jgi:hypothetical protein